MSTKFSDQQVHKLPRLAAAISLRILCIEPMLQARPVHAIGGDEGGWLHLGVYEGLP